MYVCKYVCMYVCMYVCTIVSGKTAHSQKEHPPPTLGSISCIGSKFTTSRVSVHPGASFAWSLRSAASSAMHSEVRTSCNTIPKVTTWHLWIHDQSQELMNRNGEKEWLTIVYPSCRITLQNAAYKDYNLLVLTLTSFEVATVTTMDSQEPICCDDGHLLAS